MQTTPWYRLLAAGMLAGAAVPLASSAQAIPSKGPQPKFTEIATIPGTGVIEPRKMPNGRVIICVTGDSILAFDRTTRQSVLIARGFALYLTMSPRGDRIAWLHTRESGTPSAIWSVTVDPATGAPTGPAQRISARGGDSPSLSPDGKLLAYFADLGTFKEGQDLVLIPATGGPERILAHYDWSPDVKGINAPSWSADGKWIYLSVTGDSATSLERVPAAGGARERVFTHPDIGSFHSSIDGRVSLFGLVDGPERLRRIGYVTVNGVRGEFATPIRAWNVYTLGSPGALVAGWTVAGRLYVLNLEDGEVRDLQVASDEVGKVIWSRDRKRLAFAGGTEIVVVNADGSGRRQFPADRGAQVTSWSPDDSGVEYIDGTGRTLRVLIPATGVSRVLASVPPPSLMWSGPKWQPDGKSFLLLTAKSKNGRPFNCVVVEYRLDGTRRVVRDLSAEFLSTTKSDSIRAARLLSNQRALVLLSDSSARRMVVVPLDGGAHRPLPLVGMDRANRMSGAIVGQSDDWIITTVYDGRQLVGFRATSTGTDSTRVLRFPANAYDMAALPIDANHLLAWKQTRGGRDVTLYSLPLDGSAARVVGHIASPENGSVSGGDSPDGKFLAFFSAGAPTSHIYDVDFSPIMKLVKKP